MPKGNVLKIIGKGKITHPKRVREKLGVAPLSKVEFVEEIGRVFLVNKGVGEPENQDFARLRGCARVRMSTEEVMLLTRGEE